MSDPQPEPRTPADAQPRIPAESPLQPGERYSPDLMQRGERERRRGDMVEIISTVGTYVVLLGVIASATFLGTGRILNAQAVGVILTAVIGAVVAAKTGKDAVVRAINGVRKNGGS